MLLWRTGLFLLGLLIALFTFSPTPALAIEVSGIISSDTTWSVAQSPYHVTGSIKVSEGATLTIEPGVSVEVAPGLTAASGHYISVEGTLNARGTVADPIHFTAQDPLSPWGGLVFLDQSQDWDEAGSSGSIIERCVIEFAGNSTPYGNASIRIFSAQPKIHTSTIRYGFTTVPTVETVVGIWASDTFSAQTPSGNLNIISNHIHDHGIGIRLSFEGARVRNNYLINNRLGIDILSSTNDIDVLDNTIINPEADVAGDGINLVMDADENDNGIQSYLWEQTSGPAITLEDPGSPFGSITAPIVGSSVETLTFDLTVTDDDGLQDTQSIDIRVIGTNEPPLADAGADATAQMGEEVQLDASGSYDPDRGIASFLWEQLEGTTVALQPSENIPNPTFIAPAVPPESETLTFQITITDTQGLQDTDTVDILVFDANIPPTADAGDDLFAYQETEIRLDGSNSQDPDGSIAIYAWEQLAGTTVTLTGSDTSRPSFEIPVITGTQVELEFQLTVTDNLGLDSVDTVTVTVFGDTVPPFSVPTGTLTVFQGTTVLLSGLESFDLDRKAVVDIQGNLINCANEDAGLTNISLATTDAGYDVGLRDNRFQTSQSGGLAVYLYNWPINITDPPLLLSDNWWGTTDMDVIEALIYDGGEDFNLPELTPSPASTAPVPVGSNLNYPSMADAGPDITTSADLEVALDGTGTYDPDNLAAYTWTQLEGPSVTLKNANRATASFVAPLGGEDGQTLRFRLTVKVGNAPEDTDEVTVAIVPDDDPSTIDLDDWPTCFMSSIIHF